MRVVFCTDVVNIYIVCYTGIRAVDCSEARNRIILSISILCVLYIYSCIHTVHLLIQYCDTKVSEQFSMAGHEIRLGHEIGLGHENGLYLSIKYLYRFLYIVFYTCTNTNVCNIGIRAVDYSEARNRIG